ncbi:MAG: acyltransferase 3 family protein [Sphingomonadales bacterium]|nr:acyltransferase 3 family protein [Sphingomonadales bacterium]
MPKGQANPTSVPAQKFEMLQLGRGVAAMMVVMYHASRIVAEPRFWSHPPFANLFENFNVGVDFFFVLSGFIISWAHWKDLGQPARADNYIRKRFLRIYPPYWGILFPLILFYAVSGGGDASQRDPLNMVLSIFLTPNPDHPVLGVAWTLTYEIFFYALFTVFIVYGRAWMLILPPWALAIVVAHVFHPSMVFPASFFLSPFNLDFIGGVWIAALLRRGHVPYPKLLAAIGAAGFFAFLGVSGIQDDELVGRLAFGSMAMLFVIGTVERERRRPSTALPRHLAVFGASSYALYLIHPLILIATCQVLSRILGRSIPGEWAILIMAIAAALGGIAYHLIVERKLIAITRPWVARNLRPIVADQ